MASRRAWIAGARPQTLPVAVAAALAGTAVAIYFDSFAWWKAALCLLLCLSLQVGANYANDYSDGIRGTDEARVGPTRLVAAGLATPRQVKLTAIGSLTVGACAGIVVAVTTAWWLLLVGLACLAGAWLYTGGPRPYGYRGLGELMVFVFFGPVATSGTAFVQFAHVPTKAVVPMLAAGVGIGLVTAAVLMANNIRDRANDQEVGKITLAVVIGDRAARGTYAAFMVVSLASLIVLAATTSPLALIGLIYLAPAGAATWEVLSGATGYGLVAVLQRTGQAELALTLGLLIGLAVARLR